MEGVSVAVVGAGPAGMVSAAQLLKHGASVTVFERSTGNEGSEGWNMTLGKTSKAAIEAAGLSPDFGPACRSEGISIHAPGKPERWLVGWGNPVPVLRLCTSTHASITEHLEGECTRVYGGERLKIERGCRLVGGAVCDGRLLLEGPAHSTQEQQFDLVVGADGVNSMTRRLMAEQDGSMAVSDNKSVLLLLSVRLSVQGGAADIAALSTPSGQPFHVCPPDYAGPPLTGASTAVVNRDPKSGAKCGLSTLAVSLKHGRSGGAAEGTAVLVATEEWFKSDWGGPAAAAELLGKEFPHFPTVWLQDVVAGLVADERTFRTLRFITCSKLASGRALLVGDAAHAMSPNLGMGCNISLQDTLVIDEAIAAAGGDAAAIAQWYSDARRSNAHAVVRISERLDAAMTFKHHRSVLRAALGWPLSLTVGMNYVPRTVPIPGFLRPSVHITAGLHDVHSDFQKLESAATAYFLRIVTTGGLLCAATVGAGFLLWRSRPA